MSVNVLVLVVYTSMAVVAARMLLPYHRVNPAFWFVPFNWLIGAGTIMQLDLSRGDDSLHAWLWLGALAAFSLGAIGGLGIFGIAPKYQRFWAGEVKGDSREAGVKFVTIALVSIAVAIAFYNALGYNLLFRGVAGSAPEEFTVDRLAIYGGRDYFAPGYVNQFKNVLLPLAVTTLGAWAWRAGRRRVLWAVVLVGIPLTILGLLGTGQRGPLVLAFAASLFGILAIARLRPAVVVVSGLLMLLLFGVFSSYLGRIDVVTSRTVPVEFVQRLFVEEQSAGLAVFRYVYARDVVWLDEWGQAFMGLLPGISHRGSDLDNRVFALLHGSTRGNTTPSTIGSAYHNGGSLLVLIMFTLMGFAYTFLYARFLSGPRTIARCCTYGAIFFYLASFVGGSPVNLINKGIATLMVVLAISKVRFAAPAQVAPSLTAVDRALPAARGA